MTPTNLYAPCLILHPLKFVNKVVKSSVNIILLDFQKYILFLGPWHSLSPTHLASSHLSSPKSTIKHAPAHGVPEYPPTSPESGFRVAPTHPGWRHPWLRMALQLRVQFLLWPPLGTAALGLHPLPGKGRDIEMESLEQRDKLCIHSIYLTVAQAMVVAQQASVLGIRFFLNKNEF